MIILKWLLHLSQHQQQYLMILNDDKLHNDIVHNDNQKFIF